MSKLYFINFVPFFDCLDLQGSALKSAPIALFGESWFDFYI